MVRHKALILLDVDGVLNPRMADGALQLAAGRALLVTELAKLGTIVWATSWGSHYTAELGRHLGLPHGTAAIAFPSPIHVTGPGPAPTPKLYWVAQWLRHHLDEEDPLATVIVWIDDQLASDALQWAAEQSRPTLAIVPDPNTGLTAGHVARVREFVTGLDGFQAPSPRHRL